MKPPVALPVLALIVALSPACSRATTTWTVRRAVPPPIHVFVMPAGAAGSPAAGNIGRDFAEIERAVTARLVDIARTRDVGAIVAEEPVTTPYQPAARYINAMAPVRITREEIDAAGFAREHGATHLLVATVLEWREMRTDDPIGALVGAHNGLTIDLRLVRLDTPEIQNRATFRNRSHITANQPAGRLLGDAFRKSVLELLGQ
ncbi:MAG TPA: hypothetical protein VFV78_07780 [Vicinamibacterales bacterium]|nr:hypothetical protein [Vicinamibacterales bacterium]